MITESNGAAFVGQPRYFLGVFCSLSLNFDPGCPKAQWVLNPEDKNQADDQNDDGELKNHHGKRHPLAQLISSIL